MAHPVRLCARTDHHPDCRTSLLHHRANYSRLCALLRWQLRDLLYQCGAQCLAYLACWQHLCMKGWVMDETTQWQGALRCPWLSTSRHLSADTSISFQWKPALSSLLLSRACAVRPFSTNRHASVWLYGHDGLQPVLQGCGRKLVKGLYSDSCATTSGGFEYGTVPVASIEGELVRSVCAGCTPGTG